MYFNPKTKEFEVSYYDKGKDYPYITFQIFEDDFNLIYSNSILRS